MKKVLIISYHALPMDVIASYRAKGYVENFGKQGIKPTLITHFWDDKTHNKPVLEKFEKFEILRIPIKTSFLGWLVKSTAHISILSKLNTFILNLLGYFELHTIDSYFSMKVFLKKHLIDNHYNFIVSIYSPHYQVRLPYTLYKKFNIPYAVDFRDLWDNSVIHKNYSPSFKEKIRDTLIKHYWKKWLKHSSFFSITSLPWLDHIKNFSHSEGIVITNGYDNRITSKKKTSINELIIMHTGSLYNDQHLDIFLKGIKQLLSNNAMSIKVIFVGSIRKGSNSLSGFHTSPETLIRTYLKKQEVVFYDRVDKEKALELMQKADILLFPSFPNQPGRHTGKIFDYLASNKNILMVPNDSGVCETLINECNCGFIANTPDEVLNYINKMYLIKQSKGILPYNGLEEAIAFYSREHQAKLMAEKIKSSI